MSGTGGQKMRMGAIASAFTLVGLALGGGALGGCVGSSPTKPDGTGGGSGTGGAVGTGGGSGTGGVVGTGGAVGSGGTTGTGGAVGTGGRGTGGASTGGSTGSGGVAVTGTGGGPGAVVSSDPCTGVDPSNDDRDHATPYPTFGASFLACHQTATDIDFYTLTTPAAPADGGVVIISIIDVGTNGNLLSNAYAASDNGVILDQISVQNGASVFYWFAATAATTYNVSVQRYSMPSPAVANPYTFKATFAPVNDIQEPNDTRLQAMPVAVGTTGVQGYMFAGYQASTGYAANAWEDWYKVTLAAGNVNIGLSIIASDINGVISFYDGLGAAISDQVSVTNGASVALNRTNITAGDYYIRVMPYSIPTAKAQGSIPPQYSVQPYTLTVTQ